MSAPPFFQFARRGNLLFLRGKGKPAVGLGDSLSEQDKAGWLDEASTTHN